MAIKKYRKIPVVQEGIRYTGYNAAEVLKFMGRSAHASEVVPDRMYGCILIPTLEGVLSAQPGDYVMKGVKGEFYPVKPHIFPEIFEEISDE